MEKAGLPTLLPAAGRPRRDWRAPAVCAGLAVLTLAVFAQTTGFQFVNYDDGFYVYHNKLVSGGLSLKGLGWVFTHADCNLYHPLTMLSLMWDYQFHELNAGGYHLTNVLLHTASVIVLFLVLKQMTGAFWRSAFVAAVFAVHPLRVESVAWVSERKDVLGGFFFMMTLAAYWFYTQKPGAPARYLMVTGAFILALLSKPTVVTLPFVLLLLDYWPLRRAESVQKLCLEKLPWLGLALVDCALTVWGAGKEVAAYAHVSMSSRLANAVVAYVIYLRQLFWPEGLAVFYPRPAHGYTVRTIVLCALLLTLAGAGAAAYRKRRAWLLVGWLWYLGMLIPMIGIVQAGSFAHADRMTYLAQMGVLIAVTWQVAEWKPGRLLAGSLMAVVLGTFTVCAWKQTGYWRDSGRLWLRALACTRDNYMAHYNLGVDLFENGLDNEAMVQYQKTIEIKPDHAEAWNNLGNIYYRQGKIDMAMVEFKKAVQFEPDYAGAHFNLAVCLARQGKLDGAIREYGNVLHIDSTDANAHYNLALILREKGDVKDAIAELKRALAIRPNDASIENDLAWLLATAPGAALRDGPAAVALASHINAQSMDENPKFLRTLAAALAETGRFSEAIPNAQRALDLANEQSDTNLAGALQAELKLYQAGRSLREGPAH